MAKATGLNKKYQTSDELFELTGKEEMSRAQVTKALWDHIKREGLQADNDRRIIHPDEALSPILGSKPINMMKLAGKISKHLIEID